MDNTYKRILAASIVISIIFGSVFGGMAGFLFGQLSTNKGAMADWFSQKVLGQTVSTKSGNQRGTMTVVDEESAVISAVDKVSPAVVSIIVTKDLPKIQQNFQSPFGSDFFRQFFGNNFDLPSPRIQPDGGTQKVEVGGGSGFIVSPDGYVVTNKHVVDDPVAEYTVLLNNEKKYPAKVLARDTVNDLAVLKIDATNLPTVILGDSSNLKVGQKVIAIGNALGEFRNTVSTGVVSGLSRSITAGGTGNARENLTGVIQTDASINPGNSGGPLLDIKGQVIGINTAIAQGAQNIGFAIPINEVKNSIESVQRVGRIVRPWIGVRYVQINQDIATANKLTVDYGALIIRGTNATDLAVVPGSPADKAGLVENDIILEVNGIKLKENNPLSHVISKYQVGQDVTLKILHDGQDKVLKLKLEEMK
jgi:S1-C subfamily serine protease